MIMVYFLFGGYVDDVANNRTNHQFTSVVVEHFMNSARVCWIIKRTAFNVNVCLKHSWRYKNKQFERRNEKPRLWTAYYTLCHLVYVTLPASIPDEEKKLT